MIETIRKEMSKIFSFLKRVYNPLLPKCVKSSFWCAIFSWTKKLFKLYFFQIGATVAPSVGPVSSDLPVYQEVWFIALIAIVALIILFLGLACCLRRTRHKVPYIRERMPLQAKQKKMGAPLSYVIDPYTGNVMSTVSKPLII